MDQPTPNIAPQSGVIRSGNLEIDLLGMAANIGGDVLQLQPLQVRILALLALERGRAVSDCELQKRVFRVAQAEGSTNIARQISLLRSALGRHRRHLHTVRGVGYAYDFTT